MPMIRGNWKEKEYQRYRKAGRTLHHRIIDAYVDEKVIEEAAKALGLGKKRQLVLDSEDDLSVLMDYALYEIQRDGKRLVERYAEERGGRNFIERELLKGMTRAETHLFKVRDVLPWKHQIVLESLLGDSGMVILTDVNFSQTMFEGVVLFFRAIKLEKFTMTSGTAFVFREEIEDELREEWKNKSSAERYAWFFKESKRKGLPTRYV